MLPFWGNSLSLVQCRLRLASFTMTCRVAKCFFTAPRNVWRKMAHSALCVPTRAGAGDTDRWSCLWNICIYAICPMIKLDPRIGAVLWRRWLRFTILPLRACTKCLMEASNKGFPQWRKGKWSPRQLHLLWQVHEFRLSGCLSCHSLNEIDTTSFSASSRLKLCQNLSQKFAKENPIFQCCLTVSHRIHEEPLLPL